MTITIPSSGFLSGANPEPPLVPMGDKSPPGVPYIKVVAADYDYWLDYFEELRVKVVDLQNRLIHLTAEGR